jgi:hypothetical protein
MKEKIVGICVCMLVIATALPAAGTLNKNIETNGAQHSSSGIEWEKSYGGDEFDWFYDAQPTRDGGYIATGITEEDGIFYAWLLKVNATGGEEWRTVNHQFFGTTLETNILVQCVRQAPVPDDGYLIGGLGVYYNTYHGYWFASGYLWKVNSTGSTEWFKPLTNEEEEWSYVPFVFETYDTTGWMCAGFYAQGNPQGYTLDIGLFKTDLNGNLIWGEHYDEGGVSEFVRSIWKTTDGGYFLSGTSQDRYCMIKTDSNGTKSWSQIFNGPGYEYSAVMGCRQTPDGGYIMSGLTDSYGAGGTDMWIIKTDGLGNKQWNKTYGGPNNDRNYGMDATDDGYVFVVIKNAYITSGTKEDTWIVNTDSQGNPEWELLIEEEGTQWSQSIVQTKDKGFIIGGRTGAIDSPASDGLLLKIAPFPHLDLKITGGLGVKVTITNNGSGDAIQVPYKLSVNGGILGLINETKNGTIDILAGNYKSFLGFFFRFGTIAITVSVGVKEKTATAFLLGPFVLRVK